MNVRVTGKHMDIGESFRTKINEQIGEAVEKYFSGGYSSQVVVEKMGYRFTTDCKIHLDSGANLHATGEANDPQACFDIALERIEKRLRRYKRKLKQHHGDNQKSVAEVEYRVIDSISEDEGEVPEDFAPVIVAESTKTLKTMSVADAVMALDMTDEPVLMFRTPGKKDVNLVYRRRDGNIGWIDAASIKN